MFNIKNFLDNMKFIKSSILATFVLSGLAFAACSEEDEYVMPENVKGVYFTTSNLAVVKVDPEESGFTVEVGRNGLTDAASYNIVATVKRGQGKFTFPASVTFPAGAEKAQFKVECNLETNDLGRSFPISIAFADGVTTYPWATVVYDFDVTCAALDDSKYWKKYGSAQIIDAWVAPLLSLTDDGKVVSISSLMWKVDCQESIQTPGIYRIVNPWLSSKCYLISRELNLNSEPTSIIVDATNKECVKIIPQYSGATVNIATEGENIKDIWICNMAGYMSEIEGKTDEEIINSGNGCKWMSGYFTILPALYGYDGKFDYTHHGDPEGAIQIKKGR